MRPNTSRPGSYWCERRSLLLLAPAALAASLMPAQIPGGGPPGTPQDSPLDSHNDARLPNGKNQRDEIAREDYQRNVKDARDLTDLAKSFEESLEKDDRYVLSLSSLKKLDEIDKLTKRIRGRLKRS
jgi:hypothetical protein